MTISRDLASQFAKITNDTNKQTEETVYGTVVTQGGKLYVNLDGSDSITPIVTTAEIKSGERVAVMIKGHTATVIGNITNPGASTETTGKILDDYDVIVAKIGDFELIVADKITTEQLEAELAIIEELIAQKATIEELNAVKATIEDLDVSHLEAEIAEIEKAIITKADIQDLEAVHADIEILEADLAEIETLVGGNLTMDNIQSLILTASKVTVDNAFIKDAMIDRVSASKLTAGTINTNQIQIASEDGSMTIDGSLQQFKDSDGNVRIQIGQDASGDFTFILYGEDGTGQLINQNGITASAINDGLIVDKMVADNANIAGSKLDISSVITEINGSTTNIKSSSIVFDDTGQSLTVAFNTLEDTVQNIKDVSEGDFSSLLDRMETLTTELDIQQGEIDTLVSNTTIVTENGETVLLKDDYSSTKQTVDEISSKVSSLETTAEEVISKQVEFEQSLDGFELSVSESYVTKDALNDELNNIQIGGRNLIPNSSANLGKLNPWTGTNAGYSTEYTHKGLNSVHFYRSEAVSGASRAFLANYLQQGKIAEKDTLTLSGWYYIDSSIELDQEYDTGSNIAIRVYKSTSDSVFVDVAKCEFLKTSPKDTWIRFEKTETVPAGYSDSYQRAYVVVGLSLNGFIRLSGLKLEKGNKATDWTPAPEDIDDTFTNYYTKTETDSKITVLNESISLKVSQTEVTNAINNIQIGGRNLLKGSDAYISTADYLINNYYFGNELPVVGETYIFTLKGELGSDRTRFVIYNSNGYVLLGNLTPQNNGLYTWTGRWTDTWVSNQGEQHTADNTCIQVYQFTSAGTSSSTIEWVKLEKGNKATDWTPAPEDIDDTLINYEQQINANVDSAIQQGTSDMLTSIDDLYTKKDEFESFQSSVTSQFEQTSSDIQMTFSEALVATNTVNDNLETYKAEVSNYIRFDANGIEMGSTDSPFKSTLSNEKLAFTQNNHEVAYISNNKMYITEAEITNNLRLGSWIWLVDENGNLTLKWSD